MSDTERLHAIADRLGVSWTSDQEALLLRFAEYLATEAVEAGGLGPHEAPRIMERHLGDSLVYLTAVESGDVSLSDVGSGVGLPGIPIAIARPDLDVTLLDRSQRRSDLAARAVRILGLENVVIVRREAHRAGGSWDVVTFRASLPLGEAAEAFRMLTPTTGMGIFGVSRLPDAPSIEEPPPGVSFELRDEASGVLDSPGWLLRMRHL